MTVDLETTPRGDLRAHIIARAARLLDEGGAAAVTTRRVAEEAGVQAPTIYRLFGDKDGLLDAVAEHVMALHVAGKAAQGGGEDPVEALRAGWRTQIDFGMSNPELIRLMNARSGTSPAVDAGIRVLQDRIRRLAVAGLLQVSERRALDMIHAAGAGAVQALLDTPPQHRDPGLADALFDAVLDQIARPQSEAIDAGSTTAITVQFATLVADLPGLSAAERSLMTEWLDRSTRAAQRH